MDKPEQVTSGKTCSVVFIALLALTLVTYEAAKLDLGGWNTPVGLTIAITKAALVVLYFMNVRHSTRLTWIVIAAGLLWFGVLLTLTMNDYLTRFW